MHPSASCAVLRLATAGIGAIRLGIPVERVVQAIPVPEAPAMLPRRQGALLGVIEHEGSLVPIVDLARWVDVGAVPPVGQSGQAGRRVLVLREAGRTIGLQVDSVDGLVELPASDRARLHHDDSPEEVFHSAVRVAATGHILSLLDVARLADLAASWYEVDRTLAEDAAPAGPASKAGSVLPGAPHYALLQLGAVRLGVRATDLVEVVALPRLERLGGAGDGAWCLWRGRHLAVLPPAAVASAPQSGAAALLAVIEHAGLVLGVPVEATLGLQPCSADGHPDAGGLTCTVFDTDGAPIRLLDTAALFARFPEALLSKVEPMADDAGPSRTRVDAGAVNDSAYIVFEAGGLGAAPIAALEQILPMQPAAATAATMEWNGAAIPVVDLRPDREMAGGHVLVTAGPAPQVGYLVSRVELLVPAGTGKVYRMGANTGKAVDFITTDSGNGQASYRIVDLAAAVSASARYARPA